MKNKQKKKDFFNKVYEVTKLIPYGKVTTYGDIAEACGIRSAARTVGWALNGCGPDIPAHRVVNRFGVLTGKIHFGDPQLMEELLQSEGVEFDENGYVRLDKHLWKPGKLVRKNLPAGLSASKAGKAGKKGKRKSKKNKRRSEDRQ